MIEIQYSASNEKLSMPVCDRSSGSMWMCFKGFFLDRACHIHWCLVWMTNKPTWRKKTLGEVFSFSPTYYYLVSIRFIADETKTSFTMSDCYNDIVMAVVCGSLMKIACTKIGIIFIPWPMPISNQRTIMMGTAIFFITTFLMKSLQCLCKFFEKKTSPNL